LPSSLHLPLLFLIPPRLGLLWGTNKDLPLSYLARGLCRYFLSFHILQYAFNTTAREERSRVRGQHFENALLLAFKLKKGDTTIKFDQFCEVLNEYVEGEGGRREEGGGRRAREAGGRRGRGAG
jgi:hypothetical protein